MKVHMCPGLYCGPHPLEKSPYWPSVYACENIMFELNSLTTWNHSKTLHWHDPFCEKKPLQKHIKR
jgi:hypothetical protein